MQLPERIVIEEEGLRDGLQNEKRIFSVEEKLRFIHDLEAAGVERLQVGSFVHPKWVPQMANTDEVFHALERKPGVVYTGLILNVKGLERALACGVEHLSMSMSASESHNRKNANCSREEAKDRVRDMVTKAKEAGIAVRAGIQSAFGCAYDGAIDPKFILGVVEMYRDLDVDEINLADSVGLANPRQVFEMTERAKQIVGEGIAISLHLHDTRGMGIANMVAGSRPGRRSSTPPSAVSAAAHSFRARPATSPPRTPSSPSRRWVSKPESTGKRHRRSRWNSRNWSAEPYRGRMAHLQPDAGCR